MQIRPQSASLLLARELSAQVARGFEERLHESAERARAERVRYLTGEASADPSPQRELFPLRPMHDAARPSARGLRVDQIEISTAGLALFAAQPAA